MGACRLRPTLTRFDKICSSRSPGNATIPVPASLIFQPEVYGERLGCHTASGRRGSIVLAHWRQ